MIPAVILSRIGRGNDCVERASLWLGPVAEYPRFEFSMKDVRRSGELIAANISWTDESAPQILEAFRIANSWRDAHAYPMRSVRSQIIAYMRSQGVEGITGARLKRMQAIRRKLRRLPGSLNQLQDLGGCRAILPRMSEVRLLVGALRERSRHHLRAEDDYIQNPKPDGYRSHHLMFSFRGRGHAKIYDNRRIEVQVRTRLQHAWATAVEAVGLFRREDLKGNQGSPDWLELFRLMSAEFAVAEGCPEPPNAPLRDDRIRRIKQLDEKLEAARTLENLSYAVRASELSMAPDITADYYLIVYNNSTNLVDVSPYYGPKSAAIAYDNAEAMDNRSGNDTENIVLVESDRLESLKEAYPNYFGDVEILKRNLTDIVRGKGAREYAMPPRQVAPLPGRIRDKPDTGWFRRSRFRRPRGA